MHDGLPLTALPARFYVNPLHSEHYAHGMLISTPAQKLRFSNLTGHAVAMVSAENKS
jgi:hypothetical protein